MLNKVIVMGRMVRAPELRRTESGISICLFSVAVSSNVKNKDGEYQTSFFDVVAWRSLAEFVAKYFDKGAAVLVEGELVQRKYQDKDGNSRIAVEISAQNVFFAESKRTHG